MFRALPRCGCIALFFLVGAFSIAQQPQADSVGQIWGQLTAGNHRFVTGKPAPHDLTVERKALTNTQRPQVAVLSCSDSRVPPELVFDVGLGDLFVVRSAGEDDDPISIGSLEYAVEHLGELCGSVVDRLFGQIPRKPLENMVGATGFEPVTSTV